jgi:tRNA(Ile2) C34 agmatinyltransferase TiaS
MITINDINQTIMFGELTNEQMDSIVMAIKYRRSQMTREIKRSLSLGDRVQFYSSKRGQTYTGTVEKVAVKYITVNTGLTRWRVPANMLEVV